MFFFVDSISLLTFIPLITQVSLSVFQLFPFVFSMICLSMFGKITLVLMICFCFRPFVPIKLLTLPRPRTYLARIPGNDD